MASEFYYYVDNPVDWIHMVDDIAQNGHRTEVRKEEYLEKLGVKIIAWPFGKLEAEDIPCFNEYLAKARAEYIEAKYIRPNLEKITVKFCLDRDTRQAVIYTPDWWWEEEPTHLNCILAYQFLFRNSSLQLYVFMRSSDVFNAFPYDWYAATQHLKLLAEELAMPVGKITFLISSAHVRVADLPRINEAKKKLGVVDH